MHKWGPWKNTTSAHKRFVGNKGTTYVLTSSPIASSRSNNKMRGKFKKTRNLKRLLGQQWFVLLLSHFISFRNGIKTQDLFLYNVLWSFGVDYYILIYTHCLELMQSMGTSGNSFVLFITKVMVWLYISNSHKIKIALIIMLPSNCCFEDFFNLVDNILGIFYLSI